MRPLASASSSTPLVALAALAGQGIAYTEFHW